MAAGLRVSRKMTGKAMEAYQEKVNIYDQQLDSLWENVQRIISTNIDNVDYITLKTLKNEVFETFAKYEAKGQ